MAQLDITQTSQTDMAAKVTNYSVDTKQTEGVGEQDETYWDNANWTKYFGYYKQIPELKKAVDALATWVLGQGYDTDAEVKVILEHITGWGEDTFNSILWNMLVTKKIAGDAFAEIIRADDGTLLNLKPLDPGSIRIVCNKKGRIKRYEQKTKTGNTSTSRTIKTEDMLHLCNDRIADEIHGKSVIEACEWVILARNEAMTDFKRILHRSTIRFMEVDEDDPNKLSNLKRDYADAVKSGELMLIPKGTIAPPVDLSAPQSQHIEWIRYLENFFYQALGVPKVILGGTAENTEASAKVSVIVFDPTFIREITELEQDIWNQLYLRIKIRKQPSLMDEAQSFEAKNTGQTGFQPNDVQAGVGK